MNERFKKSDLTVFFSYFRPHRKLFAIDMIKGVTFGSDAEIIAAAAAQVKALKAAGAKYVVCLGHLGVDTESVGHQSLDVIKAVSGIDLFIDGHSHSVIDGNTNTRINGTTKTKLDAGSTMCVFHLHTDVSRPKKCLRIPKRTRRQKAIKEN